MTDGLLRRIVTEKRSLVAPLAIAIVLNAAAYALVVYPLSVRVGSAEARSQRAIQAAQAAERDFAAARATQTGKERAGEELTKFYTNVLPADHPSARRITHLDLAQIAQKAGLKFARGDVERARIRDSQLTKLTVTITLEGEYRDMRTFIHEVEKAPAFVVIEEVALTQSTVRERAGLVLVMKLATYFREPADGA